MAVDGRQVLLVGRGADLAEHASTLAAAGALLTVVSPDPTSVVVDLATRGLLRWQERRFAAEDLDGVSLVVLVAPGPIDRSGRHIDSVERADRRDDTVVEAARRANVLLVQIRTGAPARRSRAGRGSVVLVGGGPGNADLLTVAAVRAIREADVIIADRLAPLGALTELSPGAALIDVGKIPRGRATCQETINALLIEHARAGHRVVRLKGGDSFVFGRGGEEVLACRAAGVDVRVVPGVTSALAVPALAGIPVTHRGLVQGVSIVSAHVPPGDPTSTLDYAALAGSGTTLVLLMAVATLPDVTAALLAAGMDPRTPAATVADGSLSSQRVVTGDLAGIAALVERHGLGAPAVTVIGAVAALGLHSDTMVSGADAAAP